MGTEERDSTPKSKFIFSGIGLFCALLFLQPIVAMRTPQLRSGEAGED
jgi:hypothetical protein